MKTWLREHRMAVSAALARIRGTPGGFSFNVLVIALALMLPLAGLTLLENLRPVSRELAVEPEISVFLSTEVARDRAQTMADDIRRVAQQSGLHVSLDFVSRDQALEAMKARAGLGDVVGALGSNPLPDAYVARIAGSSEDADGAATSGKAGTSRIEKFAGALEKIEGVETVQLDAAWVKRLAALIQLATMVLALLAATLCGVVLAVVFNTIRLQIVTQHEEIGVARLLGATDAFVARPFYYMGGLLGLAAGALALLGVLGALALLNTAVGQLASLYGSSFLLQPLNAQTVAGLLAASSALGVAGAALSVRRALRSAD